MTAYLEHKNLANVEISPVRAQEIAGNAHRVLDSVADAAAHAGRGAEGVRLLAATKTRDVGEILAALGAGIRLIGENRPQEIQIKAPILTAECAARNIRMGANASNPNAVEAHLIGQLQKNKINKVLPWVNVIESVDSATQAQAIADRAMAAAQRAAHILAGEQATGAVGDFQQAEFLNAVKSATGAAFDTAAGAGAASGAVPASNSASIPAMSVFLEVNESGEESKSGCAPEVAFDEACKIAAIPGVRLTGLMTIGAHVDDERVIRSGFAALRQLRDRLVGEGGAELASCTELSMGMTHDYPFAIAEGATIVRVGTAIFGERAFI